MPGETPNACHAEIRQTMQREPRPHQLSWSARRQLPWSLSAAVRNAAIGLLRLTGATNIAAALRRNGSRVGELLAKLGIFKQ